ncbi:MaoC family dehydratase N-terminal domain-containing protein [Mechercharimyces sp. CAU 1602]|uniref:MaoC family dehydratase N-terminal domain-containing protein n=1 Tax=Mechercharimyces sp. CAU 1602 TaxID=2973933 RepID=UPI0021623AA1|nr:MaoC family dehydratase N-terminal domain-containing protein [Mechercharimyces sp. CAU 1602]MCS1350719.1 MaoC family dehydratase N-terminal domain-containing protein [Mechercharimyces sp. CAU 1602]
MFDWIGNCSEKVKNVVERGAVKKFCEAIDDPHPLYTDEKTGASSRYGRNIAPPTFPVVFDYGTISSLYLPKKGLIHGEQQFHYERPLLIGEEIFCYQEVHDYTEKDGKLGRMGILHIKRYGESAENRLIFSSTQVIILSSLVRKEMGV